MSGDEHIAVSLDGTLGDFHLAVDFHAPMRGVTALFGPSGCGKTTILRCLAGLAKLPGRIDIGGECWQDADVFVPPHRRAVGFVFQDTALFDHLDVAGNLRYGQRRIAAALRRVAFDEAVALLGIGNLLGRAVSRLSGGQRQRVAIARALLTSPRLLLMDEPLASLDVASRHEILPYLERLHDELAMPVFYVSHASDEVARLADHLVLVDNGKVRAAGAYHALVADPVVARGMALDPGFEAEVMVRTRVEDHDEDWHLTRLRFGGGVFQVARQALPAGHPVGLRVLARDVSIALRAGDAVSILNRFPATVAALDDDAEPGYLLVRLAVGEDTLLARVTRKSAAALGLAPGLPVVAQVKAAALTR